MEMDEKWKCLSLSCVRLFATPWTIAYQAPPSMGFSRQGYWSELPFPSPSPEKVLSLCIWQFPEISPIKILFQCEMSISPYHREYFHTHVLFNVCVNCILPPHGSVCARVCVCRVCASSSLVWHARVPPRVFAPHVCQFAIAAGTGVGRHGWI